ncbi:DNA primase large subunit [Entophlyctis luteolus]|nr:DNA primase large subunit [Entophlyctis luteolus]
MNIAKRPRRAGDVAGDSIVVAQGSSSTSAAAFLGDYPFRLSTYTRFPVGEVSLAEFETSALDRLKVLKAIENAAVRNSSAEETAAVVKAASDKYLPLSANQIAAAGGPAAREVVEQRRRDHRSHFILKLAFCHTEDNRAWFVKHEVALFKYRFDTEFVADREAWLKSENIQAPGITSKEREAVASDLRALFPTTYDQKFFKVPFEQVLSLVSRRGVIVKNVPEAEQSSLVTTIFKTRLSASMEAFARGFPRMDEDDRLLPILTSIARQCAMRDYSAGEAGNGGSTLHATEVDALAAQGHFPLCMSLLHSHLKADGHLKHGGRLQFGLFLKGAGLPLDEALAYWRRAFNKIAADKFDKEYAYNVRFNYGQEGSRKNYAPYSCSKIIMGAPPGAGENHGCPFRHSAPDAVRRLILKAGATESATLDITRMAAQGHYQLACTKLFEVTRAPAIARTRATSASGSTDENSGFGVVDAIEHPNQWFDLSYRGTDSANPRGVQKDKDAMDVDR